MTAAIAQLQQQAYTLYRSCQQIYTNETHITSRVCGCPCVRTNKQAAPRVMEGQCPYTVRVDNRSGRYIYICTPDESLTATLKVRHTVPPHATEILDDGTARSVGADIERVAAAGFIAALCNMPRGWVPSDATSVRDAMSACESCVTVSHAVDVEYSGAPLRESGTVYRSHGVHAHVSSEENTFAFRVVLDETRSHARPSVLTIGVLALLSCTLLYEVIVAISAHRGLARLRQTTK